MNMLRADRKISANNKQEKTQLFVGCHRNNQQPITDKKAHCSIVKNPLNLIGKTAFVAF